MERMVDTVQVKDVRARRSWAGVTAFRLACLTAFLIALASLEPEAVAARYALLALAAVVCVPYALWFRSAGFSAAVAQGQILADLLIITGAAWLTGWHGSRAVLHLYPLVVLAAAIVLPFRRALATAVLATVAGALPAIAAVWDQVPSTGARIAAGLAAFGVQGAVLALVFGAGVFVVRRCGYADPRTARLRRLAEVMFKRLPAGLVLVDGGGRMVMVNERAAAMLGRREDELLDRPLSSIYSPATAAGTRAGSPEAPPAHRMRRADGSTFPVHVDMADIRISDADAQADASVTWRVFAFNDISGVLEMQQHVQDAERLRTAASMATQIAHEVRNPVAAISGSAQVLQQLERRSRAGDARSGEILGSERARLYDCIVEESNRLDEIIAKFLSYTEFSDDKLQLVLHLAEAEQPPKPSESPASTASGTTPNARALAAPTRLTA